MSNSQPLWFNPVTRKWEPKTNIDTDEFWSHYVVYQNSPFEKWKQNAVYSNDMFLQSIDDELGEMQTFPAAEQIWNTITKE